MSTEFEKLAKRIALIEKRLGQGVLNNASLENTTVPTYDSAGQLQSYIGLQWDGAHNVTPVSGPTPPTPTAPIVRSVTRMLEIEWDGEWDPAEVDGRPVVAPSDWSRLEVHVHTAVDFTGQSRDTLKGAISSPRGGIIFYAGAQATDYWVRLVARSTSGKYMIGPIAGPFQVGKAEAEDLNIDLDAIGGNKIYRQDAAPTGTDHKIGDLWLDTPENVAYRWEGSSWVAARDQGITQAITDAFNAQSAASQAGIDALAAVGTANTAASTASTAQTTANTAQSTANSKTTTFNQTSQPSTTGRTVGDVWIDTDDSNKRYVWTGAAWTASPIGSTALTLGDLDNLVENPGFELGTIGWSGGFIVADTAQKHLGTMSGRLDSAGAVRDAFGTTIKSVEGVAEKFYMEAWVRANGVASVGVLSIMADSKTPSGANTALTAVNVTPSQIGTTWTKISGTVTTGAADVTFTPRLVLRANIAAGVSVWWDDVVVRRMVTATTIDATARQLGAITTYKQSTAPASGMIAGDFWIDSDDNKIYRYSGSVWELSQDADINTALTNAATAQATADGKVRIFPQTTAPTGLVAGDVGDMWIDTDDGNKTYTWTGSAWQARQYGNSAIEPASLVASNVIATGTVSAALLEAVMVLANVMVAGTPTGEHATVDSTGIRAYVQDEGLPAQVSWFGRDVGVVDPATQVVVGGINETGDLFGRSISTLDADPIFGGTPLSEVLWQYPRGIVARGEYPAIGITGATNTEAALAEIAFDAIPGRGYALYFPPTEYILTSGDKFGLHVRGTFDGSAPSTTSAEFDSWTQGKLTTGWNSMVPYYVYLGTPATEQTWRLLITYGIGTGSTGAKVNLNNIRSFFVRDEGPHLANTAIVHATTGGTTGGGGSTATKKQYIYESGANWQRTWNQAGSVIYDDEMHQGYGDSFNGVRRASAGWTALPSMTGATVDKVEIYMESYWWWNVSGGTLYMGNHGTTSEPASWPGQADTQSISFTARSQGKWMTMPAGWRTVIGNNTMKGISISAPSTAATYYGKFRGQAYGRPRIRITYTK